MNDLIVSFDFDGDRLLTVENDEGIFVAVKPIAERLGLKWSGQHDRIHRDEILAEGIRVIRIPSQGGEQETVCLPLELLHGWLFTVDDRRVKPEVRERVLMYKRHCYQALFEYFSGRRTAVAPRALPDRSLLQLPMPEMLTRSRANRIWHARAQIEGAKARLRYLGDWIGLGLDDPGQLDFLPGEMGGGDE